jgi:hypothetical protein
MLHGPSNNFLLFAKEHFLPVSESISGIGLLILASPLDEQKNYCASVKEIRNRRNKIVINKGGINQRYLKQGSRYNVITVDIK